MMSADSVTPQSPPPAPAQNASASLSASSPGWSDQLQAMLDALRDNTLRLGLAGLYVGWVMVMLAGSLIREPALNALLIVLALSGALAWVIRRRSYALAGWLAVAGGLGALGILATDARTAWALALLALPVGLATLVISRPAGLLLAAGCSLAVWQAPPAVLPADSALRAVALLGVWGVFGLIWLTLRPLLTTIQWAWAGYESSQTALREARDTQVELKEALEDLAAANAQLARLNDFAQAMRQVAEDERRARERFVANVSHELRTPLNMIIGFSEMITRSPQVYGPALPPALLADLNVILRNAQHLSELIDDVLDLSQIEAGHMALTRERAQLREIIESAVVAVQPLYLSKGLFLEVEGVDDLPPLFCDPTRIREVALNLLTNAGRFTERGGVRVRARHDGNEVIVSVTDTGPGIAPESQECLFQPFQQADGSIRRRYGGSGLGLSISRSFVELHGGRMWVESAPGAGATFFFTLPLDAPAAQSNSVMRWLNPYQPYEPRLRPSRAPAVNARPQLAVVEADRALQRLLARYTDRAEIVSFASLEAALAQISRSPARALLVNDPRPCDALQRVQSSPDLPPGLPVLLCALPGMAEDIRALGVSDYLVKPVRAEDLLAALDRLNHPIQTILVADDEPDALQLFRRMLISAGRNYRVLRAENGRQAWQLLRDERPDALLLDLAMPEMDGVQLLAAKAEDPALREIPVIVTSARDPQGQPAVSSLLMATRGGGLSAQQLLTAIEALLEILAPQRPASAAASPG